MGASCDFTQIIIPYVLLQIYRMQVSQLNKENFDRRNLYIYMYILVFKVINVQIRSTVYSIRYQ